MNTDINEVTLKGNLGDNAQHKYLSSGHPMTLLQLATKYTWIDKKTNELREKPTWHRVVVFGPLANEVADLTKGCKVFVQGRLQTRKYIASTGTEQQISEVLAHTVETNV